MILTGCQSKKIEGTRTTDDIIELLWPSLHPAALFKESVAAVDGGKVTCLCCQSPVLCCLQSNAIPYHHQVII